MTNKLILYVCNIDDGGPPPHACKRAQRALGDAGHDFGSGQIIAWARANVSS
jgi:hypothetical protein